MTGSVKGTLPRASFVRLRCAVSVARDRRICTTAERRHLPMQFVRMVARRNQPQSDSRRCPPRTSQAVIAFLKSL
jgi:hypothetical protein